MSEPTPYGSAPSVETKPVKPISLTTLFEMKTRGEKIAMLTCYDASFSALLDTQHVDCILVGDSLGNVIQGQRTTIPVQMSDMVYHTKAVLRGLYTRPTSRAWVVADMPFGSYGSTEDALHNAVKLMQAGAHMVKLEGGAWLADTVRSLVNNGIPVCAHMGLTPQSVYQLGGFKGKRKPKPPPSNCSKKPWCCKKQVRVCSCSKPCRCMSVNMSPNRCAWSLLALGRAKTPMVKCWCCTTCSMYSLVKKPSL